MLLLFVAFNNLLQERYELRLQFSIRFQDLEPQRIEKMTDSGPQDSKR